MVNQFAQVAIPLSVRKTFLYSVPERFRERIRPGVRVLVPLGRRKILVGYVVELTDTCDVPSARIKNIIDLLDHEPILGGEILELTRWVADYYFAPWGMVIKAALPSGINVTSVTRAGISEAGEKLQREYFASSPTKASARFEVLRFLAQKRSAPIKELARALQVKSINALLNELEREGLVSITYEMKEPRIKQKEQLVVTLASEAVESEGLSDKQGRILAALKAANGSMLLSELLKTTPSSVSAIKTLEKKGLLTIRRQVVLRSPFMGREAIATKKAYQLTREQKIVFDEILRALEKRRHDTFLVHGVTGSGKTEIYMRAITEVLKRGDSALMLVPEIALTPAVSQLFRATFGDCVAILHSGLSSGERLDEWWRIKRGIATVVVGTRSAVFAPLKNLKLIIVDEEHDHSYKQEDTPRYNARDTARQRAEIEEAVVVLGSATPALETFYEAKQNGKLKYLTLESRILDRPLAEADVVDMRDEFLRVGRAGVVSAKLQESILKRLEKREQTLILLNRRGYSHVILCRSCGATVYCDACSITMTFHRKENTLICHYCGRTKPLPKTCLQCGKPYIYYVGEGTEKIEELMRRLFPQATVDRMDRDTTKRKESFHDILAKLANGRTDLLIGTQMIAKGHDFPNVTLVGVIAADSGLHFPDFRAAERTFQLLTQVAGRAGRGEIAGEVIIQTYYPNHYSLKFACQQNYHDFYNHEIQFRELMHYPPFTVLANILIKDKDLGKTVRTATKIAKEIEAIKNQVAGGDRVKILGPAPAPLEKIKGQYRYQILIKAQERAVLHGILEKSYANLLKAKAGMKSVSIDIDPINLM